jgi:hypothetical protein
MSRQLRPSPNCLNCGAVVATRFCSACGQENTNYRVSMGRLLGDLFDEVFQLESRLWRTLWTLFRRPGLLTREYNAGRRVSFTTPLRLYVVASVAYFFVGGLAAHKASNGDFKVNVPELSAADEAELGADSPFLRKVHERALDAKKDPRAAVERARHMISEWAPRIAACLVPLLAFLTWLCFRTPKLYFVEHLVFALHLHATAFLLLLVSEVLPWDPVGLVVFLALVVVIFRAARVVFQQSRVATTFKLAAIGAVYSIFLGIGIAGVAAFGFLSKG